MSIFYFLTTEFDELQETRDTCRCCLQSILISCVPDAITGQVELGRGRGENVGREGPCSISGSSRNEGTFFTTRFPVSPIRGAPIFRGTCKDSPWFFEGNYRSSHYPRLEQLATMNQPLSTWSFPLPSVLNTCSLMTANFDAPVKWILPLYGVPSQTILHTWPCTNAEVQTEMKYDRVNEKILKNAQSIGLQ